MGPEALYIRSLAHAYVAGRSAPASDPLPGLQWDLLATRLRRMGVLAPFQALLPSDLMPRGLRERLDEVTANARRTHTLLLLELARLLPALEDAGVRPMVLKGAALSQTVYPSPADRPFADLDILVPRPRLDDAAAALEGQGYRMAVTSKSPEYYERYHFHRVFRNAAKVTVEIHWDLSAPAHYARFVIEEILEAGRILKLDGAPMRVPSNADQLMHTALQALSEGFGDLRRMVDAALILKKEETGSLEGLVEKSRHRGLATPLWVLLRLARAIAGVELPSGLEEGVRPAAPVRRCLDSLNLERRVLELYPRDHYGFRALMRWLCSPSRAAALNGIRRYVFPGEADLFAVAPNSRLLPRLLLRLTLSGRRAWSFLKIASFVGWQLIRHRPSSDRPPDDPD